MKTYLMIVLNRFLTPVMFYEYPHADKWRTLFQFIPAPVILRGTYSAIHSY